MAWNKENDLHAYLWGFETWFCMQRGTPFDLVGQWSTSYIVRLGGGSSGEFAANSASAHARKLDEFFMDILHAEYVNGSSEGHAIDSMTSILDDNTKTVADLAIEMENHYAV